MIRIFLKEKIKLRVRFFFNGRSAFYDLLKKKTKENNIRSVLLPAFTCKSLIEVTKKLKLKKRLYSINKSFEPNFSIKKNELIVLIDYFGKNSKSNDTNYYNGKLYR